MMEIVSIKLLGNYRLLLTYNNGEERLYDMSDHSFNGVFEWLKDENNFKTVNLVSGSLTWFPPGKMEIDLCPDTVYHKSIPLKNV